ncbi:MAG: LysE family translocator [Streptosporangiales bacterium]|nr:LysE family translocator [Streptosporangiales bacterium]
MPEADTFAVFAAAALIFAVMPGPAVFYVVTRSVAEGRRSGLVSTLGIETGNLVHVVAATVGLSALLASSAVAFTVVRYVGAAYLIYLGVRKLLERPSAEETGRSSRMVPLPRVYAQAVAVATLNPKTALFFLAFLPQFVDPTRGPVAVQIGLLGVLLVAITAISDSGYALLTGTAGRWLRVRHRAGTAMRWPRLVSGGAYIALGAYAAVGGDRRT